MSSIDERIVNLKFNNSEFQKGVDQTQSSLSKLKSGLNFDSANGSLRNLSSTAKTFSLSSIAEGVQSVTSKFSALNVIGVAALGTIAAKAVTAGASILRSFTVAPIMEGLSNYETKTNSIQTILANTKSQGTKLSDVTKALAELNTYANKTVYNFADMTKNIGTFTAAGVDLKTSVSSIKGIANLAAMSGSTSQQASTAMYQLSQAIASGSVKLQDWNSVVNAGMGGKQFQEALERTARNHGVAVDAMIKKEGSFRESLQDGWLTSQILTETLSQYTGDLSAAQLKSMGYSKEQAAAILEMGKSANDSATKIRTVTQLGDALREEVGSAWANVWEALFGNINQATKLLTNAHNVLENLLTSGVLKLAALLKEWDKLGGRSAAIQAIANAFKAVMAIITPIKKAFSDIFPAPTAARLVTITQSIRDFTAKLILSGTASENLRATMRGVFAVFDIVLTVIKMAVTSLGHLIGASSGAAGGVLAFTGTIGDWLVALDKAIKNGSGLTEIFKGIGAVLKIPIQLFKALALAIGGLFQGNGLDPTPFKNFGDVVTAAFQPLAHVINAVSTALSFLKGIAVKVGQFLAPIGSAIGTAFGNLGAQLIKYARKVDYNSVLDTMNVGLFGGLIIIIKKFLDKIDSVLEKATGISESIKKVFSTLTDTLKVMQQKVKADIIEKIAISLGILTVSLVALSMIDPAALTKALGAVTVMFGQLIGSLQVLEKVSGNVNSAKFVAISVGFSILGVALLALSGSVAILAKLSWNGIAKGLTGLIVILGALVAYASAMGKTSPLMLKGAAAMLVLGAAVKLLSSAVTDIAKLSWNGIAKGLTGIIVILGALVLFTNRMTASAQAIRGGFGILLIASAISLLVSSVSQMANLSWTGLAKGLVGLVLILGSIALLTHAIGSPASIIATSTGLLLLATAITVLTGSVSRLGALPIATLVKGLLSLMAVLGMLVVAVKLMPAKNLLLAGAGLLALSIGIRILASAIKVMGGMSVGDLAKGLISLALALTIMGVACMALSNPMMLVGAAALLVMSAAIGIMTLALTALAAVGLGNIMGAILGMGTALLAFGVIAAVFGVAAPLILLGSAAIAALGVACGIAAGALLLSSVALTALGVAIQAFVTSIVNAAITVAAGWVTIIAIIQAALVGIASLISVGGAAIVAAIGNLAIQILNTITSMVLTAVADFNTMVITIAQTLANGIPQLVTAGMNMILGMLRGISSKIGAVVSAATDVVVNFLNSLSNNLPRVINAGVNLIISFVNGLANGIRNSSRRMSDAGENLASAIIQGMVNGLGAGPRMIIRAAESVGRTALSAIRHILGINSPSKEFYKVGMYSDQGLAGGLKSYSGVAQTAAEEVGYSALRSLRSSLTSVNNVIMDSLNTSPVITPVLDLSNITSGLSNLPSSTVVPVLSTGDSGYSKASTISNALNADTGSNSNTEATVSKSVTFVQNNYSPKALSAIDIYRQTNNQISKIKEGSDA